MEANDPSATRRLTHEDDNVDDDGPKIALFDMDGSLADFDAAMMRDLEALRSPDEPPVTTDFRNLEDEPHMKARMDLVRSRPGWWRRLDRIEAGFTILRLAEKIGFEINILTKGPTSHPQAWAEKLEWCQAQPELRRSGVHITVNKGMVYGLLLYDDYPKYLAAWTSRRPRGLGIMPINDQNREYRHPRVVGWDGTRLDIVEDAMRAAYARRIREPLLLGP